MKQFKTLIKIVVIIANTILFIRCSTPIKKEFSYDNSKELKRLDLIFNSATLIKDSIGSLTEKKYDFDSVLIKSFAMSSCNLPKRVANKIKNDGGLLPPRVKEFFYSGNSQFPKYVYRLTGIGKGIEYVLHLVDIQKVDMASQELKYRYENYGLDFEGFNLSNFIAVKASNLFYTLDCQGYFNAALAVHGSLSFLASIKSEATSNLNEKSTIMIGYVPVVNPFAQAFFHNLPGAKKLPTQDRLLILKKLANIPNLEDTDIISYITAFNCLFYSKNSTSSLNGDVSVDVDVKTPVVNGGVSGGFELSRNIKFEVFDTYFVKDDYYTGREKITVKDLKVKIHELEELLKTEIHPI